MTFTSHFNRLIFDIQWPARSYTLMKPTGPTGWHEGWRKQDNEDNYNSNEIQYGHHLYGSFGSNMKFSYCTKYQQTATSAENWPNRNYCILRQGISCPTVFKNGSIYWDDEERKIATKTAEYYIPSGIYDKDALINYCCRSDGSYSTNILLPTERSFYLLRFFTSSLCQLVKWMDVRIEFVKTDDEDHNNKNYNSGSHPASDGNSNNMLYYCYYE